MSEKINLQVASSENRDYFQKYELDYNVLAPVDQNAVLAFLPKIDVSSTTAVLNYAGGIQTRVAKFSDSVLGQVISDQTNEVESLLKELTSEITEFNNNFLSINKKRFKIFDRKVDNIRIAERYLLIQYKIDRLSGILEAQRRRLLKDSALMDGLYEQNLTNFREISLFIISGRKKIEELKATSGGDPNTESIISQFETKLHNLTISRMITLQTAPQIKLLQQGNNILAEKISSSIKNTIPLWKNQIALSLGLSNAERVLEGQAAINVASTTITESSNAYIKKTAAKIATEGKRSDADVEKVNNSNRVLIDTLNDTLSTFKDNEAKKSNFEQEMKTIELTIPQ